MDTTLVDITSKQLDTLADILTKRPSGLSQGAIALLAASIGAASAILSQLVMFWLTHYREKTNLKKDLIADERRMATFLAESYKELVMHKVHKNYWYRAHQLESKESDFRREYYDKHIESNNKSFDVKGKINSATSDYFKIVTRFTMLTGANTTIDQLLSDIGTFCPKKASEFIDIMNKNDNVLYKAASKEEVHLNAVYLHYSQCYDKINAEMMNRVK